MGAEDVHFGLHHAVDEDGAGHRLDRAVAAWRGLSRAAVLRLIEVGALSLNGRPIGLKQKGCVLSAGDVLSIDPAYARSESPRPDASLKLDVLSAGAGWVVVNKPAGVPVRPHALDELGAVLNALVAIEPGVVGVGEGGLRSGIVHRLDTDTSGVLLVATQELAWRRFRDAFAQHRADKRYRALVRGTPSETGSLVLPLRVARHGPAYVAVGLTGKPGQQTTDCSLAWRVIERFGDLASHIEVDLHTGFLHQARVMMAHLGHPLLGDAQYGDEDCAGRAPRQMLHAVSLEVEDASAMAPLPEDFLAAITRLRDQAGE